MTSFDILSKANWVRIYAVTLELYPGPIHSEVMFDPSEPDSKWLLITASAVGLTHEESLKRRIEWHDRLTDVGVDDIRLFFTRSFI